MAVLPRQPSGSGVAAALEGQFRCQPRARQPAVSRAVRARETRCECLGRPASHEMTPPARPGPGAASLWCCTWRPSCPLYRVPQGRFKPGHAPSKPVGREGSTRRAPPGASRFPVTVATAEIENLSHGSKFAPANFGFLKIGNADSSAFENAIKTAQKRPKTSEILAPGSVFPWS